MRKLFLLAAIALFSTGAWSQTSSDTSSADKLGWQLAVHSYSYRKFTIFEAIDKTAALGVKYMSVSGHVLIGTNSLTTIDLPDKDMEAIKARMIADGIHWPFVNIGVVDLSTEAKSRKVFEFAKTWGIDTLVAEPPTNSWDTIEKLCKEYNIKVAIHEHSEGHSIYWNPDTVLAAVANRTPLMGACGDIGHWEESGLDPLDCLKKLEGHIICLHFKDNNEMGQKGHNVPWGTGVGDPRAWMEEMKRQHFHGVFGIEYEYHEDNPDAEMAECVKFFNKTCDEIVADASAPHNTLTAQEKADGWRLLWDGKTTDGWRSPKSDEFPTKSWSIADGVLTVDPGSDNGEAESQSGGDIITRERFSNFELTADFKTTPGCNSGIKIFVQPNISPIDKVTGKPTGAGSAIGLEYQILDDERHPDAKLGRDGDRKLGALYDLIPAGPNKHANPVGEWNHARIVSRGQHVEHWLNGEKILEYDRDSAAFDEAVARSKFKNIPDFGKWADGHILLQEHGSQVSFRDVKLRVLSGN